MGLFKIFTLIYNCIYYVIEDSFNQFWQNGKGKIFKMVYKSENKFKRRYKKFKENNI